MHIIIYIIFGFTLIIIFITKSMKRFFTTFVESPSISVTELIPQPVMMKTSLFRNPNYDSLNWLHSAAPCFPLHGDKICVIHEPKNFYQTVLEKCNTAKKRIVLASLYFGIGAQEQNLATAMKNALNNNRNLTINVLLDFTRGTRGEINSQTTLSELIREKNFCLSLYHTPALRGLTKKFAPPRWNELLGLQHMKIYLFDNTLIMSGANLSNDYFTNRQDRYIMIEDKNLADFYANFIGKVQEFSLHVNKEHKAVLHPHCNVLPYSGNREEFETVARYKIQNYFNESVKRQQNIMEKDKNADTWIFPTIEMGQLGIHHDSIVTKNLLSTTVNKSQLKFATGYFNLTEDYMNTITENCPAECSILMAHPTANGFMGAKGPAGGIPAAYSLIARNFHEKLVKANQAHRVSLLEYEKPGWTYHAKGLWYYLPGSNLPCLTVIGSSNFGERSVNRDLESQVCIVTENRGLQTRFQTECEHLYELGTTAENNLVKRTIPQWVKTVVFLFKNFF